MGGKNNTINLSSFSVWKEMISRYYKKDIDKNKGLNYAIQTGQKVKARLDSKNHMLILISHYIKKLKNKY